jgi:hypothetical protein
VEVGAYLRGGGVIRVASCAWWGAGAPCSGEAPQRGAGAVRVAWLCLSACAADPLAAWCCRFSRPVLQWWKKIPALLGSRQGQIAGTERNARF